MASELLLQNIQEGDAGLHSHHKQMKRLRLALYCGTAIVLLFSTRTSLRAQAVQAQGAELWHDPMEPPPIAAPGNHVHRTVSNLIGTASQAKFDIVQGKQAYFHDKHPVAARVCIPQPKPGSCYV